MSNHEIPLFAFGKKVFFSCLECSSVIGDNLKDILTEMPFWMSSAAF
jgi:hypothetical protein